MTVYSSEEKARLEKLGSEYQSRVMKARNKALKQLSAKIVSKTERLAFVDELFDRLIEWLKAGKAPSAFIETNINELFDGCLNPAHKKHVYHTLDALHERMSTESGCYRRPMRSTAPDDIAARVVEKLSQFFYRDFIPGDICDFLEDKIPDEVIGVKQGRSYPWHDIGVSDLIAAELDFGNARLEKILSESINGENGIATDRWMIKGITLSHNVGMHELLGKLLCAARLQEGLRQAICETMDEGVVDVFLTLLNVIREKGFIRYSSVKRAAGCWLGFMTNDASKLERISAKSLDYLYECLADAKTREEYLASDDAMKIHIALWALGFYDVSDIVAKIKEFVDKGMRRQVLVASYSANLLTNSRMKNEVAKYVIERHSDDQELMAGYLPLLYSYPRTMKTKGKGSSEKKSVKNKREHLDIAPYFESPAEAEKFYAILKEIHRNIKGKAQTYSPFIFPWHSVKLQKSDAVVTMAYLANALQSLDKTDEVCSMFGDLEEGWFRRRFLEIVARYPESETQFQTLVVCLGGRDEYDRRRAYELLCECKKDFTTERYRQLEELLRLKGADVRGKVIALLLEQPDVELYDSVKRLIDDKKSDKRLAALDMIIALSKDVKKKTVYEQCRALAEKTTAKTSAEKVLLDTVLSGAKARALETNGLYSDNDEYAPEIPDVELTRECVDIFERYFPDSGIRAALNDGEKDEESFGNADEVSSEKDGKKSPDKETPDKNDACSCKTYVQAEKDLRNFCKFIKSHEKDEFRSLYGDMETVGGSSSHYFKTRDESGEITIPFHDLWKEWLDKYLSDPGRILRLFLASCRASKPTNFSKVCDVVVDELYGAGFAKGVEPKYVDLSCLILQGIVGDVVPRRDLNLVGVAILLYLVKRIPKGKLLVHEKTSYGTDYYSHLMEDLRIANVVWLLNVDDAETMPITCPLLFALENKYSEAKKAIVQDNARLPYSSPTKFLLDAQYILLAHFRKLITRSQTYRILFQKDRLANALDYLSGAVCFIRENNKHALPDRAHSFRNVVAYDERIISALSADDSGEDGFAELVSEIYDVVINEFLSVELARGDSETKYSEFTTSINRIYGVENFVAILSAFGEEKPDRTLSYCYSERITKKKSFSRLLKASVPAKGDDDAKLRKFLKGTDITPQRLVEASLYSPAWIELVGKYLKWDGYVSGCYYFIAHINDEVSDQQKAIIAKYSPLSEDELQAGAFDINWFHSAYKTLGAERFDVIYEGAKFIAEGMKHTRARQYADASLGKITVDDAEKTIAENRNKTLVMAYPLIPLTGEDDICRRYLFLQKFLKESKQFGAQRIASEKEAVAAAMRNLATNAGYADVARLTLRMETKLVDDCRALFNDVEIDDVSVRLAVDDFGSTELVVTKNGKALKSVPTKIKKNDYIVRLREMKKSLSEQYSRTRQMFEQAMEDQTQFVVEELDALRANPVVEPIIRNLVFRTEEGKLGFLQDGSLVDCAGKKWKPTPKATVTVAHSFHLYKDGHWVDYQRALFDQGVVQPFKQVFRELYVKTSEELDTNESRRYSGNQILPQRTVGCLKKRRWVADYDDGLQKVFYKENIIATIYAMCDWFTPADIEAPTLEWVAFYDRQTGERKLIRDVPDVVFSEVMRDVDLAVSVAHAGGVDPETSHSTIEMRAALAEFTLPLFKLTNVTIEKSHAHIVGKYGHYTVHLGSGVVHKLGGTMINILPVHSQHRGKLFLPFADDDPKTAEILTKILFLAEDSKIQDPSILEQIV